VDFVLEPYDGTPREVIFITEPPVGSEILIYVTTNTQCYVNGNQLVFNLGNGLVPINGDAIAVTTWNDTRQQKILSQCFVGPVTTGVTVVEPYDSTDFDVGTVTGAAGSYDYSSGVTVTINNLDIGVVITDPDRLWVSLNGRRLFNNIGFTVSGTKIILTSGLLSATDVVMITQFTNFVVPESMAFRIFQDMRGVQATYRITPNTTTATTSAVTVNADIIYVANAGALAEPNFDINVWGVATIDAERIMYRYRDTENNTISGLMRGTAGTAVTAHATGATVYNMGRDNLLPEVYQDYIVSTSTHGDGTTTVFTADNINLISEDSTLRLDALEVYVGGIKQSEHFIGDGSTVKFALTGIVALTDSIITVNGAVQTNVTDYSITKTTLTFVTAPEAESIVQVSGYMLVASNPVEIVFETAPAAGSEVTLLVRRGVTWYAQGSGTASNGNPLQITETAAARFLRGL